MSPEQARRKKIPVDHRTDVYSLGATLYEMLTLRPPFRGKDHQDTLSQIIERDPIEPRKVNPRVPKDLETIVLKCLRKEAGDRYGTAEAMGQDLRRFVRGEVIEARPQGKWEQASRRAWRYRYRIAGGLLLVALLAAAGWLLLDRLGRDRDRRLRVYAEKVEAAALRLELASQTQKDAGREGVLWLVGTGDLASSPGLDPVDLALKDLGDALVLAPERPDAHYHRARALLLLDRTDEARELLESLVTASPLFVPAVEVLADLFERLSEADRAAALFKETEKLAADGWSKAWVEAWRGRRERKPGDTAAACTRLLGEWARGREPFLGCAMAARLSRGLAHLQSGDAVSAARDFAMAQALAPEAVQPALLEVRAWYALERKAEAAKLLEATYARAAHKDEVALIAADMYHHYGDQEMMHVWLDRVSAASVRETIRSQDLFHLGRLEDAEQAARKAIEHDPRNPYAWDRLGFVLMVRRRIPEGREAILSGLKVAPDSSLLYDELGNSYFMEGDFANAAASYERCAQLKKTSNRSELYRLAAFYYLMGQDDKGDAQVKEAHRRNPWNFEGEMFLSHALIRIGRLEDALEAADRAIASAPSFANSHYQKARALFLLGREKEAIATWRTCQPLFPLHVDGYLYPALIHEEQGHPEDALTDLITALKPFPGHENVHTVLARCLRELRGRLDPGKVNQVRDALEAASTKEPASGWVMCSLALTELLAATPGAEAVDRALSLLLRVLDSSQLGHSLRRNASQSLAEVAERSAGQGHGSILDRLSSLPSPAATDALFAGRDVLAGVEAVPESLLRLDTTGVEAQAPLLYLAARFKERSGDLQSAAEMLARIPAEASGVEVALRLAEVLRAAGRPLRAEEAVLAGLTAARGRERRLWDAWLGISIVDLARSPAEVLAAFPAPPDSLDGKPLDAEYASDVRWLLERLTAHEPIRIHCGGDDFQDPRGETYSRDRFALGGTGDKRWAMGIAGTDMAPLYHSAREFEPWLPLEAAGYAIPLPPGRYRVRLHFAEVFCKVPGSRRFDVSIQGKHVIEDLDIDREVGFATALVKGDLEANVERSGLDIRFHVVHCGWPIISAIEVEREE